MTERRPPPKIILITGATGNVGRKLRDHLLAAGRYELRLLCLNPAEDPDVTTADLRTYDAAWTGRFGGVDVVVHLANAPAVQTRWDAANADNIGMMVNVYHAAAEHHVGRVVFASSIWTMYGYRFRATTRTPDAPADPGVSPYGMTKIFAERIAKAFLERFGIATIVLRIGACEKDDNVPGDHMATGAWAQDGWISNRDLCQGIEKAVLAEDISFAIVNLTSRNAAARWSLSEAERAIGYIPQDSHTTSVNLRRRLQALAARVFFDALPALSKRLIAPYW